jgi:hypothetical protein
MTGRKLPVCVGRYDERELDCNGRSRKEPRVPPCEVRDLCVATGLARSDGETAPLDEVGLAEYVHRFQICQGRVLSPQGTGPLRVSAGAKRTAATSRMALRRVCYDAAAELFHAATPSKSELYAEDRLARSRYFAIFLSRERGRGLRVCQLGPGRHMGVPAVRVPCDLEEAKVLLGERLWAAASRDGDRVGLPVRCRDFGQGVVTELRGLRRITLMLVAEQIGRGVEGE